MWIYWNKNSDFKRVFMASELAEIETENGLAVLVENSMAMLAQ